MKRLALILVILFIMYFGVQIGFKYLGNGHSLLYEVVTDNNTFQISENLNMKHKNEHDNYYFEIKKNDFQLSFQTYYDFNKFENVIIDVKYYKDNQYECALPVFRDNFILFDMMCKDQAGTIYYYHDIKGVNLSLDQYVLTLKDIGYDVNKWIDSLGDSYTKEVLKVYKNNLVDGHYLALTNYKGLYTVSDDDNQKAFEVELFGKDTYERPISIQVGRYYLTADYNVSHDFTIFKLVDMMYNGEDSIQYHSKISFNSYFMGVVGESAYLYDRSSKTQYEVDVKRKKVVEVGNETVGIKVYRNGEFETVPVTELSSQDVYFQSDYVSDIDTTGYVRVDKVGNKLSGYYYFYRSSGNGYDVYRADVMNSNIRTFLFHTSNISMVRYVDDYVYYSEGDAVKYYHDQVGVRTLLTDSELSFNSDINYYVHKK